MRFFLLVSLVMFLSGCLSSPVKLGEYANTKVLDDPQVGTTTTRALGETLVSKGVRTTEPALEVIKTTQFNKADGESSIMTCAVTVHPGTYPKRGILTKEPKGAACFGPVTAELTLSDGTTNWNCPGRTGLGDVCLDSAGTYHLVLGPGTVPLKQDFDHLRLTERVSEHNPGLVQEIIYNGRAGNSVKMLYREFSYDVARPAFAQELQYDLGESHVVGFKTLRMEILEATNTQITYRLESSF